MALTLDALTALAGTWQGTYQLRGDPSFSGDSPSTAVVAAILGGRFVRIDYTWSDRGTPAEGSLLIGYEIETALATIIWVDSWHNGLRMMPSTGALLPTGGVDVRGTFPTGPGSPDWGWRTIVEQNAEGWTLTMFNVSPEGEEMLAVLVHYVRG